MTASAAVIVITHNSATVLESCLESLVGVCAETVVVDNASSDESIRIARRHALAGELQVVANLGNRGFAGGANDGFRASSANCVLLLNPDAALVHPANLDRMVSACEEYGLASGLLIGLSDKPQIGFFARALPTPVSMAFEVLGLNRLWPSNPINVRYRCLNLATDREAFVEQPAGAFLMIRRDVWKELNGLDETFHPVWFEDADFCRRALDHGYKIRFVPSCVARHKGGDSVLRINDSVRGLLWYGSLLRYAAKHFGAPGFGVVCLAVAVGAVGRAVVGCLLSGVRPEIWSRTIRMYGCILRLVIVSLWSGRVPPFDRSRVDGESVVTAVE